MTKKVPLVELFGPTIQGEGAVIGLQTYFIRLGLCDYKCRMCDSMNAVDPQQVRANATWLTPLEIAQKFIAYHKPNTTRWVTLSGGNPCIHDLTDLVLELRSNGFKTALETQGTKYPSWLADCDVVTVSPKGPGMGENTDFNILDDFLNFAYQNVPLKTSLKIVAFDQRDLEFIRAVYERYQRYDFPIYISLGNPYPPGLEPPKLTHKSHLETLLTQYEVLFQDIQNDPILSQLRFLPQWHVFVWANAKGR